MLYIQHYEHDTQTNLSPKKLDLILSARAKQEQKLQAQIIREVLEKGLKDKKQKTADEALLGLADLGKKLNVKLGPDASSTIDDYLYGDKA